MIGRIKIVGDDKKAEEDNGGKDRW